MLNIALASDDNYAQQMTIAIYSIIQSNSQEDITFHILDTGMNSKSKECIIRMIEDNNKKYTIYDLSDMENNYGFKSKSDVLPIGAYARIFLPNMLEDDIDRILYIDSDCVNVEKLSKLYYIDMKDDIIAGVQDFADSKARLSNGLNEKTRYINSGMILFNVKLWKEENITSKIHEYILKKSGNVVQEDQGAINAILKGRIKILSPEYNMLTPFFFVSSKYLTERFNIKNFYSDKELLKARKNPIIIHYLKFNNLVNRPWEKYCFHPKRNIYRKYYEELYGKKIKLVRNNKTIRQYLSSIYTLYIPYKIKKCINRLLVRR